MQSHRFLVAVISLLCFIGTSHAGQEFPGGEADSTTPQVKLLRPSSSIRVGEDITVRVRFSRDFDYCPECATNPVTEYLDEPQIDLQGHVHAYFQRLRNGFPSNRLADSFCPFNALNPDTVQISNTVVETTCPALDQRGQYRVCVTLETNAHGQRMKATPRDFPPVDCRDITVKRRRGRQR